MPVQVADVGQEWPTYSRIDKPIANGRGLQDVTNTAFKNCVALVRKELWATLTRSKMPTRHKFRGEPTWTCVTNARRLVFVS